jgi:acetyl-CoA carboxylase carboxyltransferase component
MSSYEKMKKFTEARSAALNSNASGSKNICKNRITDLLDEESFVEMNAHVKSRGLAAAFDRASIDGDGVITGYGTISGRLVFVAAQDPEVYGGSMGQMHAQKISEIIDMAVNANSPFIGLYDTGGSRIEEGVLALEGTAQVLSSICNASDSIPVIAGVFGPCPGGSAMAASLSHFRIMTDKPSGIYMNGPMVTSAYEGKTMDPSDIGGAAIHSKTTGLASFVTANEKDCITCIKNLIGYMPGYNDDKDFDGVCYDDPNRTEAILDSIAENLDNGYAMDEIISNVVDTGSFLEISSEYASGAITALARLDGYTVGIIANRENRLDAKMARKIKSFVITCDVLEIPVISFIDCQGYAIGMVHEFSDIIEQSAELYRTMDSFSLPKISVIIGDAIGTAYLTLASKQAGFDFVYAWPTARIAVVPADTAANILYRDEIAKASDVIAARADFVDRYSEEIASADVAASFGHIDEVITPSSTRPRLISTLQIL